MVSQPSAGPAPGEVLAALRQHGWNATSFQITGPGFEIFRGAEGMVGYTDTGTAWVAAGAPIAPVSALRSLALSFVNAARERGKSAAFFGVEQRFLDATSFPAIRVGEQPTWAPRHWTSILGSVRSLREQLRRARAKGVRVRFVTTSDLDRDGGRLRRGVVALAERWLERRRMPPMRFLVELAPFVHEAEHLYFAAERGDELLGFLAAVPVYARRGWFFDETLRAEHAPNGMTELLFDAAMREAAGAGADMATLGLAPLSGSIPVALRIARALGNPLCDLSGLRAFKAKLRPDAWDAIYLAAGPGGSPWTSLGDSLRAFAGGSLLRFGRETLDKYSGRRRWLGRFDDVPPPWRA